MNGKLYRTVYNENSPAHVSPAIVAHMSIPSVDPSNVYCLHKQFYRQYMKTVKIRARGITIFVGVFRVTNLLYLPCEKDNQNNHSLTTINRYAVDLLKAYNKFAANPTRKFTSSR